MAINRLLTDRVLHRLEALRAAFRLRAVELPRFQPGGIVQRPGPVHFDCPCRLEPVERAMIDTPAGPLTVVRELVRAAEIPDDRVDEPSFRDAAMALEYGFAVAGIALAPARAGEYVEIRCAPQDSFNRSPAWELGYRWVPLPAEAPRVGYAGGEAGAIEEIRRVTAEGTHPGVAAYAPVEGPTSACFACGRNVPRRTSGSGSDPGSPCAIRA